MRLVAGVLALTAFIALAAGILPARRAARLDPVEASRYEESARTPPRVRAALMRETYFPGGL